MTQIKVNHTYEIILALLRKETHGRELAKMLKTSLTKIQAILNELYRCNAVDYTVAGKNHVYFIKKNLIARTYVLSAEQYKFAKLLRSYPLLEPVCKELMKKCSGQMLILFGSYAKFIPKERSDIDIYINTTDKKMQGMFRRIDERINVKIGEFSKDDLLIQEIIKDHILIQGGELFYEKLGFFD